MGTLEFHGLLQLTSCSRQFSCEYSGAVMLQMCVRYSVAYTHTRYSVDMHCMYMFLSYVCVFLYFPVNVKCL
jgi:hypothetical protein